MNSCIRNLILLLLALSGTIPVVGAEPTLTVAVFNFESSDETPKDLGAKVATLLTANLSAEPRLMMVERAELDKLLGEQELGLSGTISPDTAARVGQLTGAKVLITGRVFKAGRELVLVAKVIGTETSRVFGEVVQGDGATSLADLSASLAKRVVKVVTDRSDVLVAKVISREERLERLVQGLKAGRRPSVFVRISEQHIGTPVRDPAAETELLFILQRAGFTVMDVNSRDKADIELTGEAFSAVGLRKGNLISCKARLEIKAHQRKSGKLLLAERQTSVAIDVTEPTAAKTALESAALELAERIVPKLLL